MGFLTEIIGEPKLENFKLSENSYSFGEQKSGQDSVKPSKPLYSFDELERCYRGDALTFNAINKSVQMIMSGGFKNFVHEKKYVVTAFKKFFEEIGEIGNDLTFEEMFGFVFMDQLIYGNSFVEIIFNEDETKILDLAMIDPKRIDYAKKSDESIILGKDGKPIGYMIKMDNYSPFSTGGDVIPKEYESLVKKNDKSIFLLAKRIAHFKLYPVGDKFYGIGLIEPGYKSSIYKKNMEKAKANYVYQKAFGSTIAYAGNDRKNATPQDRKDILKEIIKLNYQKSLVLPHWVKLEQLAPKESSISNESINDMRIDQISALSIPDAFASGQGQTANKQTLSEQRTLWEFTLKDIINRTLSYFKKYILKSIEKYNQYGGVPEVEWGELRAEDVDVTCDKIIRLLTSKSSNITPEFVIDLEEELRSLLNIKKSGKKPKIIPEINKKPEVNINEEINKSKKETDEKMSELISKVKLLEKEKESLSYLSNEYIKNFEGKNELEKQKLASELEIKNKELENKLDLLNKEFNDKLNLFSNKKSDKKILDELKSLDEENKLADENIDIILKEKKLESIKKKNKLIEKLEKEL